MSKLNLMAPINFLSYGIVSTSILVELKKLGVDVSLFPIGNIEAYQEHHELIRDSLASANLPDFSSPSLRIFHENRLAEHVSKVRRMNFPIFERNRFDEQTKRHLGSSDTIFVCSKWAKDVVDKELHSIEQHNDWRGQCLVAPLGVNTDIFSPTAQSTYPKVVFWNQGKWEKRKGHDILPDLFKKAFENNNNVELWMSPHNNFLSDNDRIKWENLYKEKLGDKVRFFPWLEKPENVVTLLNQVDYGIFPFRSEGWGLPILECLAMGKYVCATNYSGPTEYLDDKNAYRVMIDTMEPANDGVWFHGDFEWAHYGQDQIDEYITHLREMYSQGKNNMNFAGMQTAQKFSWANTAKVIEENLNV